MASTSDSDRDLRRLAKRYRIAFKPPSLPSEQWPSVQKSTFENIRKIGAQKFDSFCFNIDIHSSEQPWREQTKHRAEWLVKRATQLCRQQRNEAGWRFGLENDVLRRFSAEVACPKCRARIWRSEIEACVSENDDQLGHLEERRRNRKPCQCPPGTRPQDYYEIGTNPLFDDRTQELILHDPLLRSELPKQEPDRVYGLQETTNFETLLSQPISAIPASDGVKSLRDAVRSSPFKEGIEPLLFPFLILEAKSEKSSNGFDDVLAQTAFPIWALLNLQANLHDQAIDVDPSASPLVWYLANRGDSWRIYACYITNDGPRSYDIFQLWDGCIMSKDSALQLLLIVDYIFDWARDVYRPSILKQLKSLVTGVAYDQVSLANDSDIFSMRRNVENWIQAPPTIVSELDIYEGPNNPAAAVDCHGLLTIPLPNTKMGTVRSASLVDSRVTGLYITESNVRVLLQQAASFTHEVGDYKTAREVLNFLTVWDDIFLLTGEDIDDLEEIWTGKSSRNEELATTQFYVLIEFSTFMDNSRNIVRELSFLAVSKPAFDILVEYADFKIKHSGILTISESLRICPRLVLLQAINCLRSGSPSQVFMAAVSCICLVLHSMPEKRRSDHTPETVFIGFGYVRRRRLSRIISRMHRISQRKSPNLIERARNSYPEGMSPARRRNLARSLLRPDKTQDLPFIRRSEHKDHISQQQYHDDALCDRCRHSEIEQHHFLRSGQHVFSDYGIAMVESLNMTGARRRHEICLFALETPPEIKDNEALRVVVEDLLQSGLLYHTICHPLPPDNRAEKQDTLFNFPLPYRPPATKQRSDIMEWMKELQDPNHHPVHESKDHEDYWGNLQVLLYCLSRGHSLEISCQKAEKARTTSQSRDQAYRLIDKDDGVKQPVLGFDHEDEERNDNIRPPAIKYRTKGSERTRSTFVYLLQQSIGKSGV